MTSFLEAVGAVVSIGLLYYGADFLVDGGVAIARRMKISSLVIGLTLVSFATSAPELVVSTDAALKGLGGIALGNVLGSNICNVGLILGLSVLVKPITINRQLLKVDVPVMLFVTAVLAGLWYFFRGVGRIAGGSFFAIGVLYTVLSIWWARRKQLAGEAETEEEKELPRSLWKAILLVVLGIVMLCFGGKLLVNSAVHFARLLHVSEAVIALTVVAVGTSLPELATSILAAMKGENDIAVGNVVGSNFLNIVIIMGISPLCRPVEATGIKGFDVAAFLLVSFILVPMLYTGKKLGRISGGILLFLYVAYTTFLVATL
ncbi:MAG: calcium/sodium antiporter [Lentisphaeria bacterium]|nr:calcium/sodium antiporter [Lentisphaeria bacterium]